MAKKVLFLVPYPSEGASARLRVEAFLPYSRKSGIECTIRPFYTASFYKILYQPGNSLKKVALFLLCSARRVWDVITAGPFDAVFIHREAFPVGLPVLEAALFLFRKKVVFDFDDAIYLAPHGSGSFIAALKCPRKTDFIIKHSDLLIVGNEFLRKHAQPFNKNIKIIPTCIDTDSYCGPSAQADNKHDVIIGWIGSHTTQVYLKELERVFLSLLAKKENLMIHLIGGGIDTLRHERVIYKEWSLEREKDDIQQFDIGIMPMPDTDWTKGKCAFKIILYMSFGIPVVASAVGVNKDIVKNGVNGFLATGTADWEEKLLRLVNDRALRRSMGEKGRATAEKGYSLKANAPKFVDALMGI